MNNSKLIKTTVKRIEPLSLIASSIKSADEWKAEETEHFYKLEDIKSVTKEVEDTYRITVDQMPFENTSDFKLISYDERLEDLI